MSEGNADNKAEVPQQEVQGGVGVTGGMGAGVDSGAQQPQQNAPTTKVEVSTPATHSPGVSGGVGINAGLGGMGLGLDSEAPNSNPMLTESLRMHSVCARCTLCSAVSVTKVEVSPNILSCLFAYFCTEFWVCYVCFRRKDWSVFNARHTCGSCGKYIDTYSSC
jgi:hypothetical protein